MKPAITQTRTNWLMLIALGVLSCTTRLSAFTGLIASDDIGYSGFAQQISAGAYRLFPHHYAIRYGLLLPVAAIYRVLGVHEWTTVLAPLIMSSFAPVLVALIAIRVSGVPAAWISGILLATFPVDIRYASILVPEPVMETLVLMAALCFLRAKEKDSTALSVGSGILFGAAYLAKEPAVFVALAIIIFAMSQRWHRLALAVSAGLALTVGAELCWYWMKSGDVLFRLHAMAIHNSSEMAIDANKDLVYRLLKIYPRMMLVPSVDFGLHSVLALLAIVFAFRLIREPRILMLFLWAAIPLAYLNFGSSSLRFYWALPVAPRYIGLIYAPLFVASAIVLVEWARTRQRRVMVAAIVAVVGLSGIACAMQTRKTGYGTAEVARLERIAQGGALPICEFGGPKSELWKQVVQITAPHRLGCLDGSINIGADTRGLPVALGRNTRLPARP